MVFEITKYAIKQDISFVIEHIRNIEDKRLVNVQPIFVRENDLKPSIDLTIDDLLPIDIITSLVDP